MRWIPTWLTTAIVVLCLAIPTWAPAWGQAEASEASDSASQLSNIEKFEQTADATFSGIVGMMAKVLFFPIGGEAFPMPFVVAFLVVGSVFFGVYHRFINLRGLKHSVDVIRGKFDADHHEGEITHFRALTSALSATIGLGNIAGVAVAISLGGPGAVFWMMLLALFGMAAKFHECTLAQMYRKTNEDGSISGGPMYYLDVGLAQVNASLKPLGKVLAVLFAVLCIGGSFGGGNMFQSNQAFDAFYETFVVSEDTRQARQAVIAAQEDAALAATDEQVQAYNAYKTSRVRSSMIFGVFIAGMVAVVILGGITRIGAATCRIVPLMCGIYILAAVLIIATNLSAVPETIASIFKGAFSPEAGVGGIAGVMIQGFKRAAFSNEAGVGSAAIAHSAAKTNEPVREGMVAMIGPLIDTIIICFMTSLVILITQSHTQPGLAGAAVTTHAFGTLASWFPAVLAICIVLFAFSTMISWSYYGERAWAYLFGIKTLTVYRVIFVIFVFFGAMLKLGSVIDFSDLMILSMAFPNIVGGIILAPKVKAALKDYWSRYQSGQMKKTDPHANDGANI